MLKYLPILFFVLIFGMTFALMSYLIWRSAKQARQDKKWQASNQVALSPTMVEKICRAMAAADGRDPDGITSENEITWTTYKREAKHFLVGMTTMVTELETSIVKK